VEYNDEGSRARGGGKSGMLTNDPFKYGINQYFTRELNRETMLKELCEASVTPGRIVVFESAHPGSFFESPWPAAPKCDRVESKPYKRAAGKTNSHSNLFPSTNFKSSQV
jgi:hypothetical protein